VTIVIIYSPLKLQLASTVSRVLLRYVAVC